MDTEHSRIGDWLVGLFFAIVGFALTIASWVFKDAQNKAVRGIVLIIAIAGPGVIVFGLTFWVIPAKQFASPRTGNGFRGEPLAFTMSRILGVAMGFLNVAVLRGWL
jgi:hypothetical protein